MSPTTPARASSTPRLATVARISSFGWRTVASLQRRASTRAFRTPLTKMALSLSEAPGFEGKRVINDKGEKGDANDAVIKALIDAGNLLARGKLKHEYPHSWRSKKPIIFRNTPQWFIAMDRPIAPRWPGHEGLRFKLGENEYLASLDTLRNWARRPPSANARAPPTGENRIKGMVSNKPDWVLSRQRAWGVPLAIFARKGGDEILFDEEVNARIAEAFEEEGADAWFAEGAKERFLGASTTPTTTIRSMTWSKSGLISAQRTRTSSRTPCTFLDWPASCAGSTAARIRSCISKAPISIGAGFSRRFSKAAARADVRHSTSC